MKQSIFTLEALPSYQFKGFTNGDEWNGWACPYFTFDEAVRIKNAHNNAGLLDAYYDEQKDIFVFEFPDGSEEYKSDVINGNTVYAIGNGAWIWEEKETSQKNIAEI